VLEIRPASGAVSSREVPGEACEDVIAALALVAALAIDPHASTRPVAELEVAPAPTAPAESAAPLPPLPAAPRAPAWRASGGTAIGARTAIAPSVATSGFVFAGLDLDRDALVAPSLRLAFGATLSQAAPGPVGSVSFGWQGGRAEICPLRVAFGPRLDARPCAAFELGALSAAASGVPEARSEARVWAAAAGGWRLEWEMVRGTVFVELAGEVAVPFARDRFYFGPDATIYEVPAVGAGAWLGLRFVPFS
jgi:hypothetical protein